RTNRSRERARGRRPNNRSVWSPPGIILYEPAVAKNPFSAREPLEVLQPHIKEPPVAPRVARPERNISEALEKVILRALTKNRDERFWDAEAFQTALEATPEGLEAIRSIGVAGGDDAHKQARRWAIVAGVMALVAVGVT